MASTLLPARPSGIEFDTAHTAVIVVDMQHDFGSRGGMFDRAGIDITPIQAIVPALAAVLAAGREAGLPVVYLKQQHAADLSDAGSARAPHFIKHQRMQLGREFPAPDGSVGRVLVADTWNTAILPELAPHPGDDIEPKSRYSGFFHTDLHDRLQAMGVDTLIVTGTTTSICVESTVRDAMFRDYRCIVLEDCTAEPIAWDQPRTNHEACILTIELQFAWVSASTGVIEARLTRRAPA
jgi:ureidoacrylate peracid hydrolase